jgi:hypothetical protein
MKMAGNTPVSACQLLPERNTREIDYMRIYAPQSVSGNQSCTGFWPDLAQLQRLNRITFVPQNMVDPVAHYLTKEYQLLIGKYWVDNYYGA